MSPPSVRPSAFTYGHDYNNHVTVLLRTDDGGASWNEVLSTTGFLRDGFFLDATTGWVVGTHIWKTTDGGVTFVKQFHNTSGSVLNGVSFSDAQNGWAVGWYNTVLRTTNGGQTWTPQTTSAPPQTVWFGVSAVGPLTGWLAGTNEKVVRTLDGGQSWQSESIPVATYSVFECAEFLDANTGWVCGDAGIYKRARQRG